MYGEAFKCDRCGRVVFTQQEGKMGPGTPPEGWWGLSQALQPEANWPLFHFDSLECLYDFITDQVAAQEAYPVGDDGSEPDAQPEPAEAIISEWSADQDAAARIAAQA